MTRELPTTRGTLVLGMHRSGTSATARVLSILLKQDLSPLVVSSNPHGQWERLELRPHLDRLLVKQGASWDCPPPASTVWTTVCDPRAVDALGVLGNGNWIWKDPRLSLTLPFWLNHLAHEPRLVLPLRDPLEVAGSLARRDGRSHKHGLALWEQTLRCLITGLNGRKVFVVNYADLLRDPKETVGALVSWLGSETQAQLEGAAASIISKPRVVGKQATDSYLLSPEQNELVEYLARPVGLASFDSPLPPATPSTSQVLGTPSLSRRLKIVLRSHRSRFRSTR